MKTFLTIAFALLLSFSVSAKQPYPVVFLEKPDALFPHLPTLLKGSFKKKEWDGKFDLPLLGERNAKMPYFESSLDPTDIVPGASDFGITLVQPMRGKHVLGAVVVMQASPREASLANEAINAFLPLWLTQSGIDMYAVYSKPPGEYKFSWDGQVWSFDQLTEALSSIIPGQLLPGGYFGNEARQYICDNSVDPTVGGHQVYAFTRYLVKKTNCNTYLMHNMAGDALKAFMASAPKLQ